MKIYFWESRQVPDGFQRIIHITDRLKRPFSETTITKLASKLQCSVCFPAPELHSLLILSRDDDQPTICAVRQALQRQAIVCQVHRGGIFNPYLPVRPYDAWDN